MKIKFKYLASALVVLAVLAFTPAVMAHADSESTTTDKTTTTTTTTSEKATLTEAEKSSMTERVKKLKTDLKVKLTTAEETALKAKCKPAQTVVTTLNNKTGNSESARATAYGELTDRLTALVGKLKTKGVDTAELEAEITTLTAKVTTFTTDFATYKTTLSDLSNVDCATDPTAFKAALLASRTAHDKVIADAKDIKTYVTGTIKVTIQKIRTALEAEEKSNTETQTESEGSNR